mmetsp:Transcript_8101/g.20200  ORF Transcript_8101/g.20200 Transcript_8101/m.20200 type:complete len:376 (-) Transcript_8101:1692-2819(-)
MQRRHSTPRALVDVRSGLREQDDGGRRVRSIGRGAKCRQVHRRQAVAALSWPQRGAVLEDRPDDLAAALQDREVQGSVLVVRSACVHLRAGLQQRQDSLASARQHGQVQGHMVGIGLDTHRRRGIHYEFDDFRVPGGGCRVQGHLAAIVPALEAPHHLIDAHRLCEQQPAGLHMASRSDNREHGIPVVLGRTRIGAVLEQHLHHVHVAVKTRLVHGRTSTRHPAFQLRPGIHKRSHDLHVATGGRVVQRCRTVHRRCVDRVLAGEKHRGEARMARPSGDVEQRVALRRKFTLEPLARSRAQELLNDTTLALASRAEDRALVGDNVRRERWVADDRVQLPACCQHMRGRGHQGTPGLWVRGDTPHEDLGEPRLMRH